LEQRRVSAGAACSIEVYSVRSARQMRPFSSSFASSTVREPNKSLSQISQAVLRVEL
jgi:hypothetical protein